MYYFHVYSKKSLTYSSNKYDSFVELVNNANYTFDYVDKFRYQLNLFRDSKLLFTLISKSYLNGLSL